MRQVRMGPKWAVMLLCASAVAAPFGHALADDIDAARRDFVEGVKLFQAGDYEGARRLFARADSAHHAPAILYNLGRVEERLNHPQAAVDAYEKYLTEAGERAEFAQASVVAIAQLKARSGRLQIESEPSGARVFVNGDAVASRTPVTLLVAPGHHHVAVEADPFRATEDVQVSSGETRVLRLRDTKGGAAVPAQAPILPPELAPAAPAHVSTPQRDDAHLSGWVFGAAFVVVPYVYLKSDSAASNHESVSGVLAGLSAELGYAITKRAALSLRALGSLGSQCDGLFESHVAGIGPAIAVRVADPVWIGGALLGGHGKTCRDANRFTTDVVFSPSLDVAVAVANSSFGQWLISASVGFFFANPRNDNQLLYTPVGFGPRVF